MTQQIVNKYRVTIQRHVIEETSYEVYATSQEEADTIGNECLENDTLPEWEFPDNWCTDVPLQTSVQELDS